MKRASIYLAIFILSIIVACDRTDDPIFQKVNDDRLPVIVANTNFTTPALAAAGTTTVAKNATVKVELQFQATDPIKEIQFLQKVGTADSTVIATIPYAPAFSKSKQCDTLIYNYIAPSTPATGTSIAIRARVLNQNGLFRDRLITYKLQ